MRPLTAIKPLQFSISWHYIALGPVCPRTTFCYTVYTLFHNFGSTDIGVK